MIQEDGQNLINEEKVMKLDEEGGHEILFKSKLLVSENPQDKNEF